MKVSKTFKIDSRGSRKMEKHKIVAAVILMVVLMASVTVLTPSVSAPAQNSIVLPFHTSWEDGQPHGRVNSVDFKKDFYGYYGPGDPLPPELGYRYSGDTGVTTPVDGTFFGYNFGSRFLMAAGYFGASYSYAYFNLFDQNSDSDYGPPFKIRSQTFINIWYYHYKLANSMIDAEIYNVHTKQYSTLRDFYNGGYIVDQNGKRLHPAWRYDDPIGSWQFASFDLSIIYQDDPENWYVTKIWIGFDNGGNGQTGQCRTYFDMLFISYGLGGNYGLWTDPEGCTCGSIVAWDKHLNPDGKYSLWLKVTIAGHRNVRFFSAMDPPIYYGDAYPYELEVTVDNPGAQALLWPEPTGVNLTQPDPQAQRVWGFIMDCLLTLVSVSPGGPAVDVADLANKFYGLIKGPEPQPTYTFPHAIWTWGVGPERASGEVYILISGIAPGETTIPIKFKVLYYSLGYGYWDIDEFTLNFPWSSSNDPLNIPPETPSTPSGPTSGYVPTTYTYSTSTTDPNEDNVRYVFDWGDGTKTTTGWYASGATATASHSWSSPGTYDVTVRAQDSTAWSGWSSSLAVSIVNRPPNTPSQPSGTTTVVRNVWYTYSTSTTDPDGDDIRYEFEFSGPIPTVSFTTGWYASGETGSITIAWEDIDPLGTYQIRVRAQDVYGLWSGWSPSLTVTLVLEAQYVLTVQAGSGGTTSPSPGSYQYDAGTESDTFTASVTVTDYKFDEWTLDGVTHSSSPSTTVTMDGPHTLKACFSYTGGCVAEGTLITMADESLKPVEKIKVGDQVLGFDPSTGLYMAENVFKVTKTYVEVIVNINNGALRLTPLDQPIFIRNSTYEGWVRDPATIQVGWEIFQPGTGTWVAVTSMTYEEGKTRVYDLVLDGYQTFIANGILLMDKC